ncbi:MAG: quinone-dependent dihydroorotate dehydrogenase [Actinomycetaceae bacterium]|nr:quinone-dependent dihydroorotate dehydrogenase [Actinomycetaceae bacterium]
MIYRHLLSHSDPEKAHTYAMDTISVFGRTPFAPLASRTIGWRGGEKITGIFAKPLPGRVGLAAGQDKKAAAIEGLDALGFAFVEVGTITPEPQPGNEQPRLWRVIEENALRNRMGFNNEGARAAAARLKVLRMSKHGREIVVGVNIGKNKWTTPEDAPKDYEKCASVLAPYADYLVINVSSPNTPGLRDLQAVDSLREIAWATRKGAEEAGAGNVPILVKIAPDLADEDIDAVAHMVVEEKLDGVVATNTTIKHEHGEGGVSGAPVRERALEVVSRLRAILGRDYIIIGVGGIFTVADAEAMIAAGADLIEILTSFITEGPLLPGHLNRALARRPV